MIGADEFNIRNSQSTSQSSGDTVDFDFIETFFPVSRKDQLESGLLIDIVCPQPPSQRDKGTRSKHGRESTENAKSGRK